MPDSLNDILLLATVFAAVVIAAFWLAIVIWAYRDMRSRSRDPLAQFLVAVLVFLLNIPGLFIYILLRPRETLSAAYERSLEEEALLQEIEERPSCPGCAQRVQHDWQACPHCHHQPQESLRQLRLLASSCPGISARAAPPARSITTSDGTIATNSRHVQPSEPAPIDARWVASQELE